MWLAALLTAAVLSVVRAVRTRRAPDPPGPRGDGSPAGAGASTTTDRNTPAGHRTPPVTIALLLAALLLAALGVALAQTVVLAALPRDAPSALLVTREPGRSG